MGSSSNTWPPSAIYPSSSSHRSFSGAMNDNLNTCTHTMYTCACTRAHAHVLVLAHCHNWSRGSPLGRGERDSKGILERWLNWPLNRPTDPNAPVARGREGTGSQPLPGLWCNVMWDIQHRVTPSLVHVHGINGSVALLVHCDVGTCVGYPTWEFIDGRPWPVDQRPQLHPQVQSRNFMLLVRSGNQSESDISFISTIDYTRVTLAKSSPWLTGMCTSN